MNVIEPEYITIIEGPTPEFQAVPSLWLQSVYEGPVDAALAQCELRTANGDDIVERCQAAWRERRPVLLDFPDDLRMRQEVEVVAMRLREVEEGTVLVLWVRWPLDEVEVEEEEEDYYDEDYYDEDYYDEE
ncbi:MAG: hypothetical protein GX579_04760 [Chloroflexi bacterium]|nr:hypothetical protein [Chloroflexota bacterium]